ncbi:MAG: porin family protein [Chitinophagaceae bacterium]|nr:porin family protein [Chitinophagaceae bacterium]MCW5926589.1 porin family protein [Chitinophagaceae bacterium]
MHRDELSLPVFEKIPLKRITGVILTCILLQTGGVLAKDQETAVTADTSYSANGFRVTAVMKDLYGKVIVTTEYFYDDKDNPRLRYVQEERPGTGSIIRIKETGYREDGTKANEKIMEKEKVESGSKYFKWDTRTIKLEWKEFDAKGEKQTGGSKEILLPEGTLKKEVYNPDANEYSLSETRKGTLIGDEDDHDDDEYCSYPRLNVSGGYSYLHEKTGNVSEGLPLGGEVSVIYKLGSRIGAGINASIHSRKKENQTVVRSFVLVEAEYTFTGKTPPCEKDNFAEVHVLLGAANNKSTFKYGDDTYTSKSSGFAFGAGMSGVINITTKTSVKAGVDYIGVKFKNSDEVSHNIRAGAGLNFRF